MGGERIRRVEGVVDFNFTWDLGRKHFAAEWGMGIGDVRQRGKRREREVTN